MSREKTFPHSAVIKKRHETVTFTTTNSNVIDLYNGFASALVFGNDNAFDSKTLTVKAGPTATNLETVKASEGTSSVTITIAKQRTVKLEIDLIPVGCRFIQFVASGSLDGKGCVLCIRETE